MQWSVKKQEKSPFKRATEWHDWFAWYPVTIGSKRVWLETVETKIEYTDSMQYNMFGNKVPVVYSNCKYRIKDDPHPLANR